MASPVISKRHLVPSFTGLGAPHWDAEARGAIFGLTKAAGPAELSKAALEAVCYQTRDLLEAMRGDCEGMGEDIRVRKYNGWKDAVRRTLSRG